MPSQEFELKLNRKDRMTCTLYSPDLSVRKDRTIALIVPGMGIKQTYYKDFAYFLATQGFDVLTWDWLGIGKSASKSIKSLSVSAYDWATSHLSIVISWAKSNEYSEIIGVGHSFGGQCFLLNEDAGSLSKLVFVASQLGTISLWEGKARFRFKSIMQVMSPLSKLFGYFPARLLGMGENLPKNVAIEWASWCKSETYNMQLMTFSNWTAKAIFIRIADDSYAPKVASDALFRLIPVKDKMMVVYQNNPTSQYSIGHFGYFKKSIGGELWEELTKQISPFNLESRANNSAIL